MRLKLAVEKVGLLKMIGYKASPTEVGFSKISSTIISNLGSEDLGENAMLVDFRVGMSCSFTNKISFK